MSNDSNKTKVGVLEVKDSAIIGNKYIKNEPFINEDGIYIPAEPCTLEGVSPSYRLLISKEIFIEAYNKFIKGE